MTESIELTHPTYDIWLPKWTRSRDVVDGTDAIKAKRKVYLPALGGQDNTSYKAYLSRALLVNLAGRSLSGLVGMLIRRTPTIDYTDDYKKYFIDATNTGISFDELFIKCAYEILLTARIPLLIDRPQDGGRPYIVPYMAEQLTNWSVDSATGKIRFAIFKEDTYGVGEDKFSLISVDRYRVLYLDVNGIYTVEIYEKNSSGKYVSIATTQPMNRGVVMDYVPLVVITPFGLSYDLFKPPVIDIIDINLSHYRTSADLEHGRHFTALPTPIVSGITDDKELKIGSEIAWILPNENAKAYYLEFTGQGLQSLEKALSEKQSQIAQFSVRLMDTSTRGSEATDTVKLRYSGEAATISSVAYSIEKGLNSAYNIIGRMEALNEDDVNVSLHKDFVNTKLTHQELKELTNAFLENAIDEETYLYNLERGEVLKPKAIT